MMWQGLLALKNDQAAVQMHFVSGNPSVARASLPPIVDGEAATVRISQRMRLDPTQLEGVFRKIQVSNRKNENYKVCSKRNQTFEIACQLAERACD